MKALILIGGQSSRMGKDKSHLRLNGRTLLERTTSILQSLTDEIYLSVAHDDNGSHPLPVIHDLEPSPGPLGGLQAAFQHDPTSHWLLIACDLPRLTENDLAKLKPHPDCDVTCFLNPLDQHPEPLCALYSPSSASPLNAVITENRRCARRFLHSLKRHELVPDDPQALLNLNRPEHLTELEQLSQHGAIEKTITVEYFAKLSAEANTSQEEITTTAATLTGLWEEVRLRHQFTLDLPHIKPAIANEFASWETLLNDHDTVSFMPPFAGG